MTEKEAKDKSREEENGGWCGMEEERGVVWRKREVGGGGRER